MKLLSSILCISLFVSCSFAQIKGSGNVTTENRTVTTFNKIKMNGVFNVTLQQGNTEGVTVTTDDNLQPYITVTVDNGTLTVGMKKNSNFSKTTKMELVISCKAISDINNNLVGNLTTEGNLTTDKLAFTSSAVGNSTINLTANDLLLNLNAVGNTKLLGTAVLCTFTNKSVGDFDGAGLLIENLTLKNKAVGNTTYNAIKATVNNDALGNTKNVHKD